MKVIYRGVTRRKDVKIEVSMTWYSWQQFACQLQEGSEEAKKLAERILDILDDEASEPS